MSASTPTYPGDPPIEIRDYCSLTRGDVTNTSMLTLSAHTGTHIDAPAHFFADGAPISALPLETVIGKVHVVEL
ncbi:MAG: cyclase family protein [Pyrinomonadaceae bacterium]